MSVFVRRCYEKALAREPDEGGFAYWVENLRKGLVTSEWTAYYFIFSPEGVQKGQETETFLTMIYRLYMDREPEEEGFAYWNEILEAGTLGREEVAAYFGASPEFRTIVNSFGLD